MSLTITQMQEVLEILKPYQGHEDNLYVEANASCELIVRVYSGSKIPKETILKLKNKYYFYYNEKYEYFFH